MIPCTFICSSDMRRGSEQLNPIHSFQITNDSAAFFFISVNISFPKWKHSGLQSSSSQRNWSWTLPALPWKSLSSVYFLKMRRSGLCCLHDMDGPWIYIVKFSSYNIYRDVFISIGFPTCLKKSCVWMLGGYITAVLGAQGESYVCI